METKTKKRIVFAICAVVATAAAVLFGIYDLQISTAIVQQENPVGLWLEFFGTLVGPFIFMLSGLVGFIYCKKSPLLKGRRFRMFLCILSIMTGAIYCTDLYIKAGLIPGIIGGVLTIALFVVFAIYAEGKTSVTLKTLCYLAVISLIYLLAVLLVINLFKVCWGRVRFRELEDLAQFSPWFIPQGINGHRSFPSGHTANAATLYVLTLFAPLCKSKVTKALCHAVPIAWIVVMAASRVYVGAHYCSDVLFGALISIALFYLVKRIVYHCYLLGLKKEKATKLEKAKIEE